RHRLVAADVSTCVFLDPGPEIVVDVEPDPLEDIGHAPDGVGVQVLVTHLAVAGKAPAVAPYIPHDMGPSLGGGRQPLGAERRVRHRPGHVATVADDVDVPSVG